MSITPENIKAKAASKKKENKKFFQRLRKRPPKDLDDQMQGLHEEVFADTDCLTCANCCKTTSPIFTDKDIHRIAKRFKLKAREFSDRYLKIDEDGDQVLKSSPCSFLQDDNKCMIYDIRPKACAEYPHTDRKRFHQITQLTLKNLSICPAAFRIVEKLKEVNK